MLKCRDVTRLGSDWIDRELSLRDRIRVRMHLLLCRHCRRFMNGLEAGRDLIRQRGEYTVAPAFYSRLERVIGQHLDARTGPLAAIRESLDPSREASNQSFMDGVTVTGNEKVQRIFAEIEAHEGMVPNLYRAYAHNPDILEHNWNRVKTLMYQGQLSLRLKNAIATAVSLDNGCEYCVAFHTSMLKTLGMSQDDIDALLYRDLAPGFSPQEAALLHLARQSNRDPHGTSRELIDQARNAGAGEALLVEALGVMELYSSFNKFLDTLNIPLDEAANSP